MLIEVRDRENGKKDPYKTGYRVGLKREFCEKLIKDKQLLKNDSMFVEQTTLRHIMGSMYGVQVHNKEIKNGN